MKILVIGSGGREHAILWKLSQSVKNPILFIAPGNGGTGEIAQNIPIKASEIKNLADFARKEKIDLTIVGPDNALADGTVDEFEKQGLSIFGPTKAAAQLESSKSFAKQFMKKNGIPTAEFKVFNEYEKALAYLKEKGAPIVIKASGLALGKGVYVCKNLDEAISALKEIMVDGRFGDAGNEVVVEEYLEGQEVSFHAFCDGRDAMFFPTTQDHKTIFEGDKGPNTGGMGTFGPVPWVTEGLTREAKEKIVNPTLSGMQELGIPYKGLLYPGIIVTKDGPKLLEFNARFGDPETQSYMRLLETDLIDICQACIDGILNQIDIKWSDQFAVCVVLASEGYPENYVKDVEITGIKEAEETPGVVVFQAGTKMVDRKLMTAGGRVLGVTATGKTLSDTVSSAYKAANKIYFKGMQYRKDIGAKSLK